jgi:hypothetical protein
VGRGDLTFPRPFIHLCVGMDIHSALSDEKTIHLGVLHQMVTLFGIFDFVVSGTSFHRAISALLLFVVLATEVISKTSSLRKRRLSPYPR